MSNLSITSDHLTNDNSLSRGGAELVVEPISPECAADRDDQVTELKNQLSAAMERVGVLETQLEESETRNIDYVKALAVATTRIGDTKEEYLATANELIELHKRYGTLADNLIETQKKYGILADKHLATTNDLIVANRRFVAAADEVITARDETHAVLDQSERILRSLDTANTRASVAEDRLSTAYAVVAGTRDGAIEAAIEVANTHATQLAAAEKRAEVAENYAAQAHVAAESDSIAHAATKKHATTMAAAMTELLAAQKASRST